MTPAAPFALTKIQAPRPRAGLVERPALEQRLAQAIATQRLVLLSAPAGFGKTALLTRALDTLRPGAGAAWIALDDDDDLQRLLACLVAALEPLDPPWRVAPEALVAQAGRGRAERRSVADEIVNTLAATELARGVIVLDDLHRCGDPAVSEFLDLLVERLPERWTIVVASRVEPPLALARWRAADELAELREPDLRFGADEARALGAALDAAGQAALRLHDADIELLLARTGGWVAGLRLALRSAHAGTPDGLAWGRAGAAMDRHAFDYLASEVLDELPGDLRRFLLRCAVLPELSAARCAAVAQDPEAARHLAEIERRGLFAAVLDGPEPLLRLHDLFRDFLEDRLRREAPDELPVLLQRAAADEPDDARRIALLMRAADWAGAEAAVGPAVRMWLSAGLLTQAQRVLDQFPAEWCARSARLTLLQGMAAWARWDVAGMDRHFGAAERIAVQQREQPLQLQAQACLAITHCQMDRRAQAAELLDRLHAQTLPDDVAIVALTASVWLASDHGPAEAAALHFERRNRLLAATTDPSLWYRGSPNPRDVTLPAMRRPLLDYLERALAFLPDQAGPLQAIVLTMHGLVALWQADADAARERLARAEQMARWLGRPRNVQIMLTLAQGLLHAVCGDIAANRATIERLLAEIEHEPPGPRRAKVRDTLHFQALRMAVIAGDTERAGQLVAAADRTAATDQERIVRRARAFVVPAYEAELQGRWPDAAAAWCHALATPAALEWHGLAVEAPLRAAHALLRCGRPDAAPPFIDGAWQRCESDGWFGSALLAGPQVLGALATAEAVTLAPPLRAALRTWHAAAQRLRSGVTAPAAPAFASLGAGRPAPFSLRPAAEPATPGEPLSARERAVLERLAAGDSNKLIARAFDLSPHTVKRHVANILDKLGAQSRGQAAAWYRSRG